MPQSGGLFKFPPKNWTFGAKKWRFIQSGALIKCGVLFARIRNICFCLLQYSYLKHLYNTIQKDALQKVSFENLYFKVDLFRYLLPTQSHKSLKGNNMWFEEIASYICFIVSTFKVLFFECKRQICSKGTKAQPTVL